MFKNKYTLQITYIYIIYKTYAIIKGSINSISVCTQYSLYCISIQYL